MFEMVIGYPPFYSEDPMTTCRKIVHWKMFRQFPADVPISADAKDLIERLLCDVETRLGTHGGAEEIKAHPFFRGIDWSRADRLTPPNIPELRGDMDTSNFENFDEDENMRTKGPKGGVRKEMDPHFAGYSHRAREAVVLPTGGGGRGRRRKPRGSGRSAVESTSRSRVRMRMRGAG